MPNPKHPEPEPAPQPPARGNGAVVVLFVAVAVVAFVALRSSRPTEPEIGSVLMPPLEVAGWFNSPQPIRNEDLRGRFVVVDCWFVDCPPCRASMPQLADFRSRFRNHGIEVIGLTPDSGPKAKEAETFIKSIPGVDWPIGYGASIPLDILGVYSYPTLILFDQAGRSVWAGHDIRGLEKATIAAMAR